MSETNDDIGSRLDESTLQKLRKFSQDLPEGSENVKPLNPRIEAPILLSQVENFLNQDRTLTELTPNLTYLNDVKGLTKRISAVVTEHFGDTLPILHFTNAATGDEINHLISSGFLERFMEKGLVGQTHVGAFRTQDVVGGAFRDMSIDQDGPLEVLDKARELAKEFHRHGVRTNKNQLGSQRGSKYSLPAVILFPKPEKLARGTDRYDHWIVKDPIGPEQIMTVVNFDPVRSTSITMHDKDEQDLFLKKIIQGLGNYRLGQLKKAFEESTDISKKQNLALYAHDLVDSYILSAKDYDDAFDRSILSDSQKTEIEERRKKFNLLKDFTQEDQIAA